MARINWHESGSSIYETGCDRAVLYVGDNPGVAWNGVIGVTEATDLEIEPLYFNATKYNDLANLGDFSGTIVAVTYPDEFLPCEGIIENEDGVYLTEQPISRFNLCYRTLVNNENSDFNHYKIHILYNLTAVPQVKTRKTLSMDMEIGYFTWNLTSIPENVNGFRPTSHIIFDSRKLNSYLLNDIEDILYGHLDAAPKLPDLKSLLTFIRKWDRIIINDNLDGTWSIETDALGVLTYVNDTTYTINSPDIVNINADEYTISSSDKNEEDI